jgi:hypothetical protein
VIHEMDRADRGLPRLRAFAVPGKPAADRAAKRAWTASRRPDWRDQVGRDDVRQLRETAGPHLRAVHGAGGTHARRGGQVDELADRLVE